MQPDLFSAAQPYQDRANSDAAYASKVTQSAGDLPTMLKQALDEKLSNSPVVSERSKAASDYLTGVQAAPSHVMPDQTGGVILNPNQQNAIISGYRNNALTPLISANQRYDLNTGSIGDIIGGASNAAGKVVGQAQGQAQDSAAAYKDIMSRLMNEQDQQYKYDELAQRWAIANLPSKSGGTGGDKTSAALQEVADAARNGTTLTDVMKKFGTNAYLNPDDILRIYNTNSIYGPAKENSDTLSRLFGVSPQKTTQQTTLTPITSTASGKTTNTGLKIKTPDGVTRTVLPAPKSWFGFGSSPTAQYDPTQIYKEYQAAGASDADILQRLQQLGFQIQ